MAYKRYIKKGSRVYGPYIYHSKKVNGKVVSEYLGKDLVVKEKDIRGQLRNEFELKLKKQIQEHEEDIRKKKLNLELEMQKKIKQILR